MMSFGQVGYALLQASGVLAARRALAPRTVILAYHNVIGEDQPPRGESSLHLSAARFTAQMEWLSRHFEVVPLGSLAEETAPRRTGRPLAVLTFDDAYAGVFRHALPVLQRLRLPATIFIVELASAAPTWFWWDALAEARPFLDRTALRDAWAGKGVDILQAAGVDRNGIELPDDYLPADWGAINAASSELVEFGAHSSSHPLLTALRADELEDELLGARRRLNGILHRTLQSVAYPYGGWDTRVRTAAAQAGYSVGVTIDRTLVKGGLPALSLPRQTISAGVTSAAFAAAASQMRL